MIEFVIVGFLILLVLLVVMNGSQPDDIKQVIVKQVAKAVKKMEKYDENVLCPDLPM